MHPTLNDIPKSDRRKMIVLLNDHLANALDLYSQVKQAHWNVKGPSFASLHRLFDEVAATVLDHVDELAERAVQLGGPARGTIRQAAKASDLKEYPETIVSGEDHVRAVASALALYGGMAREAIERADKAGDADTADLFTQISRAIDKALWMVEAHMHAKS